MKVSQAHASLQDFCTIRLATTVQHNAGVGISMNLVQRFIETQVANTNFNFNSAPSNQTFNALPVDFTAKIDSSGATFIFDNDVNPNDPTEEFPVLKISGVKVNLEGQLQVKVAGQPVDKAVVEIQITYPEIVGRAVMDGSRLGFSLLSETHQESRFDELWGAPPPTPPTPVRSFFEQTYAFTEADWNNLEKQMKAVSLFSGNYIAGAIMAMASPPDLLSMFVGIKFGGDFRLKSDGDLLMITATSELNFKQCPAFPVDGTFSTHRTPQPIPLVESADVKALKSPVGAGIDDPSPANKYPVDFKATEQTQDGDLFLFTPKELLRLNFDGVIKPSITLSDSGDFGPFYWRYSLTTTPNPDLAISLNPTPWPIEFFLDAPIDATGQAGAGIEIGCVRWEALGVMFNGRVDPLRIAFAIYFDFDRSEIVFVSRIDNISAHDFVFRTWPDLGFPITDIGDEVLSIVAEALVNDQAGRILNTTRIPVARLGLLNKNAKTKIRNALAHESDAATNDVTIGIGILLA